MSHAAPAGALGRYLEELRIWGERMNLVGSTEPEALDRHVADSLAAASALPQGARVVDLGSGAGFPGLPIALRRPDVLMTLVDSREKRVNFLRHVVRTLHIDTVTVVRARIQAAPPYRYDYALLRAVAPPGRALELAMSWLQPEGEAWIWSSDSVPDPAPLAGSIPLDSGGRILRFHKVAVSRGTEPGA